ncbi:hypothetical protein E1B28_011630 [Marasmius oreades]|uniref:Uncharacterized protein n=1 Tax=Marasmius oreades TaxID=181124 RepID=A0A9P7RV33_9AGAR|nr:uncharacterized protein E1B28_011630 [Marasmius oreades]KAG7090008.1 hypothetical protein E1B28_011630 [Marasmius oreades]
MGHRSAACANSNERDVVLARDRDADGDVALPWNEGDPRSTFIESSLNVNPCFRIVMNFQTVWCNNVASQALRNASSRCAVILLSNLWSSLRGFAGLSNYCSFVQDHYQTAHDLEERCNVYIIDCAKCSCIPRSTFHWSYRKAVIDSWNESPDPWIMHNPTIEPLVPTGKIRANCRPIGQFNCVIVLLLKFVRAVYLSARAMHGGERWSEA